MSAEVNTLNINQRAYDKLTWARRKDESYSDVIIRLVSTKLDGLQRRGDMEVVTSDEKKFVLSVEQSLCMGAESCVALAPEIFALDSSQINKAPLGMRDVMAREVPSEKILSAAQTCPYKAIHVKDADTGEQLFP